MANEYDPQRSSTAVGGRRRGLLPLLLLALAVIIAIVVISLVSCGGDDDSKTTSSAPPAGAKLGGGTLTAANQTLLTTGAQTVGQHVRDQAIGRDVRVLSVAKAGFFVGTDARDRQYVEYSGKVGADEPGQQLPTVGERVDLTGPVRPAPKNPGRTLLLNAADTQTVTQRGAFINADTVSKAG